MFAFAFSVLFYFFKKKKKIKIKSDANKSALFYVEKKNPISSSLSKKKQKILIDKQKKKKRLTGSGKWGKNRDTKFWNGETRKNDTGINKSYYVLRKISFGSQRNLISKQKKCKDGKRESREK